jgi:hypothetical protein
MRKKTELWILMGILVFAFFLRVYALGNAPLWIDESTSAMASRQIVEKGIPRFDSGLLYSRAYSFHYLQAFFILFSQSEFSARFVSVIFGMLTIVLAYFIGKEYSKKGGLIAALFFAVFYLEVFYSRQARFYQMFQFFFFLSLYLLYKSKKDIRWIYPALISFFITLDIQIEGLILSPFFIVYIIAYTKEKWLSIFPLIPLVKKFMPAVGLSTKSTEVAVNYASEYFSKISNMAYVLLLSVFGVVWAFIKNKKLTILMVAPAIITLIGVFSLQTFALRYSYFFVFPVVLYSSLLFSFLYEKFGKIMLVPIFILLILPSNLIFPHTYTNVIIPISYNLNDLSAPETNYKVIPQDLMAELKNPHNTVISLFSSNVEWYIKKPNYVIPFTMNGIGEDQISMINSNNKTVDRYSGAEILNYSNLPAKPYYVLGDFFSASKLKPEQRENFENLTSNCTEKYASDDLVIWKC